MNDPRNNMMMADGTARGKPACLSICRLPSAIRHPFRGFTLVELMIVVALLAIAMGIALPTISSMTRQTDRNTAENTVTMAGTIARAYATRPVSDVTDADPGTTLGSAATEKGSYSGCIALFTPAGEIRIAENGTIAQRAAMRNPPSDFTFTTPSPQHTISALERLWWNGARVVASNWGDPQQAKHLNGFTDLHLDYIRLPADTGVAGVIRNYNSNDTDPPRLLAPPFAVWFDANGTLVVGSNNAASDFVYYDSNHDGYDIGGTGPGSPRDSAPFNPYNPDEYDPNSSDFDPTHYYQPSTGAQGQYELPFERIETVMAVMVYSKRAFKADAKAGSFYWDDGNNATIYQKRWTWMKNNAHMVLFTHHGTTLRGLLEQQ